VAGGKKFMGAKPPDLDRRVTANETAKHALFEPIALLLLSLATVGASRPPSLDSARALRSSKPSRSMRAVPKRPN
jgi:hypothetical protein